MKPDLSRLRPMMNSGEVDFGHAAADYARHRQGFPPVFFERLLAAGLGLPGQRVVDLGTGTGTLARALARRGCRVTGVDRSPAMVAAAQQLAAEEGLSVAFRVADAAETGLPGGQADLVIAGQCWHWLDRPAAAAEALRLLAPGGALVICHLDWLQRPGNVVDLSVQLAHTQHAERASRAADAAPPASELPRYGMYPWWAEDVEPAGLRDVETFGLTVDLHYSHEAWRGRMRASALVGGSLPPDAVAAYDAAHAEALAADFPAEPLAVPHRVWAMIARR